MSRDLGRLLKIASNKMSTRFDIFAKKYDLTGTQMTIIDYLSRNKNKEVLQRDLESEFNIKSSTATVLLQRMEIKKLLYRKVSGKDSRQKCLKLTEKANKLETIILSYMDSDQSQMTSGLNKEEVIFLEKILKRMIESN